MMEIKEHKTTKENIKMMEIENTKQQGRTSK